MSQGAGLQLSFPREFAVQRKQAREQTSGGKTVMADQEGAGVWMLITQVWEETEIDPL